MQEGSSNNSGLSQLAAPGEAQDRSIVFLESHSTHLLKETGMLERDDSLGKAAVNNPELYQRLKDNQAIGEVNGAEGLKLGLAEIEAYFSNATSLNDKMKLIFAPGDPERDLRVGSELASGLIQEFKQLSPDTLLRSSSRLADMDKAARPIDIAESVKAKLANMIAQLDDYLQILPAIENWLIMRYEERPGMDDMKMDLMDRIGQIKGFRARFFEQQQKLKAALNRLQG